MTPRLKIWMFLLILLFSLGVSPAFGTEEAIAELQEEDPIWFSQGSTNLQGGGDYIGLKSRNSFFGLVYGNESHENSPHIVLAFQRPLGITEVKDSRGYLRVRESMKVFSGIVIDFSHLLEFSDVNQDGVFDYGINGIDNPIFQAPLQDYDLPIKLVNLSRLTWTPQYSWEEIQDGWSFFISLTAINVPYHRSWTETNSDSLVSKIEFSFNINLTKNETIVDMPILQFEMSQDRDAKSLIRSRFENVSKRASTITTKWKFNHYFEGWDFQDNQSLLGLGISTKVSTAIPRLFPVFLKGIEHEAMLRKIGGKTRIEFNSMRGNYSIEEDSQKDNPEVLKVMKRRLMFRNAWRNFMNMTWSKEVIVDSQVKEVGFQLSSRTESLVIRNLPHMNLSRPVAAMNVEAYFVYPQGNKILHDPEISTLVVQPFIGDLLLPRRDLGIPGSLLLIGFTSVLAVASLLILSSKRSKPY